MFTVPYINGRIFDINSHSYLNENGASYCSKELLNPRLLPKDPAEIDRNLQIVTESYGSNATFCVANPYTPYWQNKVAEVTAKLVRRGADGVYIDQVGAAPPKQCWDRNHGHTLGGGTYWTHGYGKMLQKIAGLVGNDAAVRSPIVTEDCAEPYMGGLHGYLVLGTFKNSLASPTKASVGVTVSAESGLLVSDSGASVSTKRRGIAPAFPVVYGGYYTAIGAEWFVTDFNDHNWWRGKLAAQLHSGVQMGWFSLAGVAAGKSKSKM